ncbi:hypothetical protein [endosymbiont GvMRE of Glomus versiforme]|uniref:hypothetical protein n=1 Tax=endosymbiont GvMRE of Glomus versiforme TaxID=2039283 RepID=UPI0011C3DA1B|nr:hypothetical protein [endosymbiont GvMRE of Glomus versiforme]
MKCNRCNQETKNKLARFLNEYYFIVCNAKQIKKIIPHVSAKFHDEINSFYQKFIFLSTPPNGLFC